jgi:hypothetical protein
VQKRTGGSHRPKKGIKTLRGERAKDDIGQNCPVGPVARSPQSLIGYLGKIALLYCGTSSFV